MRGNADGQREGLAPLAVGAHSFAVAIAAVIDCVLFLFDTVVIRPRRWSESPALVVSSTIELPYEDPKQDLLIGLLRLRQCSADATFRPELAGQQASIVRELHVYGSAVPVHSRDPTKFQHQGYGTLLMEEAERIAREEHGSEKIAVISGVGTRHYYRKLGFVGSHPQTHFSLLHSPSPFCLGLGCPTLTCIRVAHLWSSGCF
jgi:hypothetical protein